MSIKPNTKSRTFKNFKCKGISHSKCRSYNECVEYITLQGNHGKTCANLHILRP